MKILVVDDEPRSLKLAHAVLMSEGYDVSPANGARAALTMIREDKPDLILLDLVLPDMDGLALIRQIKSNPETHDIQIIAITAFPDRFTEAAVMEGRRGGLYRETTKHARNFGTSERNGEKKAMKKLSRTRNDKRRKRE